MSTEETKKETVGKMPGSHGKTALPTVSNISISDEYVKLYDAFGFGIEDFIKINEMAIKRAFLSEEEKERLLEEIR